MLKEFLESAVPATVFPCDLTTCPGFKKPIQETLDPMDAAEHVANARFPCAYVNALIAVVITPAASTEIPSSAAAAARWHFRMK